MYFDELELEERLLLARRGTAYFAQRIAELTDHQLDGPSLLPTWTRRHLLAHVGYNAAALCRLLDWAATGVETPMYPSAAHRDTEIAEGATLTAGALRNLFNHTAARLDKKWRGLPPCAWTTPVRSAQGRLVSAAETVWMRNREVWIHAVDLGNGARFCDFPPVVLESLLTDIVTTWHRKAVGADVVLAIDGRDPITVGQQSCSGVTVSGPLPAVVRWAAGRGSIGIRANDQLATAPRWL